jgi:hypothetical protein
MLENLARRVFYQMEASNTPLSSISDESDNNVPVTDNYLKKMKQVGCRW